MAKSDYLRLVKIQDSINHTQALTDSDLDFLVSKLKSQPVQSAAPNTVQAENLVLAHTYGTRPKRLTPAQRHRLYDAILPYTKSPDEGVQVNTTLALASTRDPRAVPVLQRLSRSSRYPLVRRDAADFLKQLQKVLAAPGR